MTEDNRPSDLELIGRDIGEASKAITGALQDCWSLLVAEMAAERTVPAPNPWTPDDPKEAA